MTTTDLADLHPLAPEVVRDPYGWYARLRAEGSVVRLRNPDLYVVTGYEDANAVLHDPTRFSSTVGYEAMGSGYLRDGQDASGLFGVDMTSMRMLITTDPPDHTRIRRLLSRAFTPRSVMDLEPRLRELCDEMVDALIANVRGGGGGDVVHDLAIPFPVLVIAELLGVPSDRRADFRRWSDALVGGLSGDVDMAELAAAGVELFTFMSDIVEQRRADPGDDLISRMLLGGNDANHGASDTSDDGTPDDVLHPDEIVLIAILLLVAGNETTTNLIANAWNALATHADEAERVRSDPTLVPNAIEEVLRWDSPVQCLLRGTTQATTLGRYDVPAGAIVLVSFAAANRDPTKFADPDRFDITRGATDHLAFGHGIHFCLGAALARVEARLAVGALLAAGVEPQPAPDAIRTTGLFLHGFTSFPITALTRA